MGAEMYDVNVHAVATVVSQPEHMHLSSKRKGHGMQVQNNPVHVATHATHFG